jgi:aspartate carbamoyltransferase catalytic subunit
MSKIIKIKDLISIDQLTVYDIKSIFKTTNRIIKTPTKKLLNILKGKIITLLFYEPSSRTFSSFATAAKRLGAQTLEYQNPLQTSSSVKGETLEDSIKVFENYSDAIIIRHPEIGVASNAANAANIPIINAGDGAGEHPTQALLDLYTIFKKHYKINNLTGLIVGDLLYGRTVHSLLKGFSKFANNAIYLLSPKKLQLPPALFQELSKSIKLKIINHENEIPANCHFWYWTRVQKERFKNIKEYEKIKNSFILTPDLLNKKGNKKMIIMHPLPRVGEIDARIDTDYRAIYLNKQIKNGMYVRMALLKLILK